MLKDVGGFKSRIKAKNKSIITNKKETKTYSKVSAEETLKKINSSNTSVGILTSEILLTAPKGYFFKFQEIVDTVVSAIQQKISTDGDGQSEDINRAQLNPDDKDAQRKAQAAVSMALTNYSDSNAGTIKLRPFEQERKVINALVINEIIGLGPLEPLWQDEKITEIIANGPFDIQVEIAGAIHVVDSCRFKDSLHLENLINRMYRSINKSISRNDPIVKGRLHDKSRTMAIHQVVAPDGPNFNIRRHIDDFIPVEQLIEWGTVNEEIMKDLGNFINAGLSFLIVGGTSTGKTTLLDSLTSYIKENKRCISLEDNLEMKPHPDKLFAAAMETLQPKPGAINDRGVTMRDLVKASLQMRPETIIVGEVTDDAAYDLCQALNTGHDGASTVHANSPEAAMYRLMSLISQSELVKEHAAYDLIATAFDIIIYVEKFPLDGTRKIVSVNEIGNKVILDEDNNKTLPIRKIWEFVPNAIETQANNRVIGDWVKVNDVSDELKAKHYLDINPELSWEQLKDIAKIKGDE